MNERREDIVRLAKKVAEGSIVAQATERLVYQIVEVCAEHERETLAVKNALIADLVAALRKARQGILDWLDFEYGLPGAAEVFDDIEDALAKATGGA